jgi:hypothetical protein
LFWCIYHPAFIILHKKTCIYAVPNFREKLDFANMRKILLMVGLFLNSFAFSQVAEDFSDGEVLHYPQWEKDTGRFYVNSNKQLQSKVLNKSDTAFISTPNRYLLNTTWEFYVQINTDPSTSNQMRIYLAFDKANLDSAGNGYFLQIGETGSSDSYDLYRKSGKTITKIIDGPVKPRLHTDTLKAWFYIIHRVDGYWELYSRDNALATWNSEGNFYDRTFRNSSYFGLALKHTSTRSDKFILDNIAIYPYEIDSSAPEYMDIEIQDSTISLLFSEELDTPGLYQTLNYRLNNVFTPKSVRLDGTNQSLIHLTFNHRISGGRLTLSVPALQDVLGNKNDTNYVISYYYLAPLLNHRNDVIISEIMADPSPSVGLPESEYIEWYNASGRDLFLEDWLFVNGNSSIKLKPFLFKADSIVLFCKSSDTNLFKSFGKVIGLNTWPSVGNSTGILKIIDNKGLLIDEVNYNTTWYKNKSKINGGYSLECTQAKKSCEGVYVWEASRNENGGSPGSKNSYWNQSNITPFYIYQFDFLNDSSIYIRFNLSADSSTSVVKNNYQILYPTSFPKAISKANTYHSEYILTYNIKFRNNNNYRFKITNIKTCDGRALEEAEFSLVYRNNDDTSLVKINELMIDPSPSVGLAEVEYIELFNTSQNYVNLSSYTLNIASTKLILPNYLLKPTEYVLICASNDTNYIRQYGAFIDFINFPSLSNTASTISLQNKAGRVLDRITYRNSWYLDNTKTDGGWSLELADPYSKCTTVNKWRASIHKSGGSPGKRNSVADFYSDKKDLSILYFKNLQSKQFTIGFNKSVLGNLINPAQIYFVGPKMKLFFPDKLSLDSPYYEKAIISFNNRIAAGNYTLVCQYIPTCSRNDTNILYPIKILEMEQEEDDYILSEIMADPSPSRGYAECEYIELFNKSDKDLVHTNLYIADTKDTVLVEIEKWPANSHLIICDKAYRNSWDENILVIPLNNLPSIDNTIDTISLLNAEKIVIDKAVYSINMFPADKKEGGYSLAKLNNTWDCSTDKAWQYSKSNKGGSPGTKNDEIAEHEISDFEILNYQFLNDKEVVLRFNERISDEHEFSIYDSKHENILFSINSNAELCLKLNANVLDGELPSVHIIATNCLNKRLDTLLFLHKKYTCTKNELLISEILFNPEPNGVDFIELYNNSTKTINLENIFISDGRDTIRLSENLNASSVYKYIQPNEYRVLSLSTEDIMNRFVIPKPQHLLPLKKMLSMPDEGIELYVLNDKFETVDRVQCLAEMHYSWLTNVEGRSLERKRFSVSGFDANNWASASDNIGKASPTGQNSQFVGQDKTSSARFWLSNRLIKPLEEDNNSSMEINYNIEGETVFMNVKLFSVSGAFISEVMQGISIRNSGKIKWDLANNKQLVPAGTYILSIECYTENGKNQQYKLPFMVHY